MSLGRGSRAARFLEAPSARWAGRQSNAMRDRRRFSCGSEGTLARPAPPSRWSRASPAAACSRAPRRAACGCGRSDTRTGLRRWDTHSTSSRSTPTYVLDYAPSVAPLRPGACPWVNRSAVATGGNCRRAPRLAEEAARPLGLGIAGRRSAGRAPDRQRCRRPICGSRDGRLRRHRADGSQPGKSAGSGRDGLGRTPPAPFRRHCRTPAQRIVALAGARAVSTCERAYAPGQARPQRSRRSERRPKCARDELAPDTKEG